MKKYAWKKWLLQGLFSIVIPLGLAYFTSLLTTRTEISKQLKPVKHVKVLDNSTKINEQYRTRASIIIRNIGLANYEDFSFKVSMDPTYTIEDVIVLSESYVHEEEGEREPYSRSYRAQLWMNDEISGEVIFLSYVPFNKNEKVNIRIAF